MEMGIMLKPKCIASCILSSAEAGSDDTTGEAIFFRNAQWSADGTCLIATLSDNSIQTFVVPADLMDEQLQPHTLTPFNTIKSADSVTTMVGYPFFNLQDPSTTLLLSSLKDHPIRLSSALTGHMGASYPLVNPMTEAFISPHSLLFSSQGDRFVAGSESLISVFDVSRPGEEPISSVRTGPKKRRGFDNGDTVSMRGIVSALAIDSSTGLLAAGTYSRFVGLYDSLGQGDCVGVFSTRGTSADAEIGGLGVTQVDWSTCGRYLYITERKSDGVMLYDIRKTGQLLSWITGRNAKTNQRLCVDLVATGQDSDSEIWAGGLDGVVRMWKNPHHHEGAVLPSFDFAGHNDAVSSSIVHHNGSVLATCSGQRHLSVVEGEEESSGTSLEASLKIWTL